MIQKELDKTGFTIDEDVMESLKSPKMETVNTLFMRIERFIKILCGQSFIDELTVLECENIFSDLEAYYD